MKLGPKEIVLANLLNLMPLGISDAQNQGYMQKVADNCREVKTTLKELLPADILLDTEDINQAIADGCIKQTDLPNSLK